MSTSVVIVSYRPSKKHITSHYAFSVATIGELRSLLRTDNILLPPDIDDVTKWKLSCYHTYGGFQVELHDSVQCSTGLYFVTMKLTKVRK
jgi:hypothetical protein